MEKDIAFIAQGHYGRSVEVRRSEGVCFECRYKKNLLIFDNSDEEYTPMQFCRECLIDFHEGKGSKSTWQNDVSEVWREG